MYDKYITSNSIENKEAIYMNKKLKNIIVHAYNTVPYYMKIINNRKIDVSEAEDLFYNTPIISKKDVLKNPQEFLSNKYQTKDLKVLKTSGSTGKPFEIYKSKKDIMCLNMPLWRIRINEYNIYPYNKCCIFFISHETNDYKPVYFIENNVLYLSSIKLDSNSINEYIDIILAFRPEWISAAPNILFLFVTLAYNKRRLFSFIKYIELSGEYLTEYIRNQIEDFFSYAIIVNQYGTRETFAISIERKCGHMHILNDNVFVENDNNFLVTSLNSFAMPIIRYQLEDKIRINDVKCFLNSKELKIIGSRDCSFLTLNNIYRSPTIFNDIVQKINNNSILIKQFQIVQININTILVKFIIDYDLVSPQEIKKRFLNFIGFYNLGQINIEFEFSKIINVSINGKFYYFVNKYNSLD